MEERRSVDARLDDMSEKITKIYTVLIGNGVPGLVQKHDDLESKVGKIGNNLNKIIYGFGGITFLFSLFAILDKFTGIFK